MPSNSEMYERGILDAAHDDLNTFYYQHYYYYRRGYNDARRKQRGGALLLLRAWGLPLLAIVALGLAGAAVFFWLRSPGSQPEPLTPVPTLAGTFSSPTAPPAARPTSVPTVAASPTPVPVLRVGGRVRVVNVGDSPLRARAGPGLAKANRVVARFPLNSEVVITQGPQQSDGLTWWRIKGDAGEGWSAERSAEGLVFLEALP
jgi:hypothetical protein